MLIIKFLGGQRNHWTFLFIFYVLSLNLYYHYSGVLLLVVIFTGGRILFLKPSTWWYLLCLGAVVGSRAIWQANEFNLQQQLPADMEMNFTMEVDPLKVKLQDNYLSGQAMVSSPHAVDGFPVAFIYWIEENYTEILPPFISEKVTQWQVKGSLVAPEKARNFYGFDNQKYLKSENITWQLAITSIDQVLEVKPAEWKGIKRWRLLGLNLRAKITKPLREYQMIPWVGIHNKLLFNLDSEAYRAYRDDLLAMGIVHYFAISGFHLYYIRRLLRYLLLRFGITQEATNWLVFIILLGYGWLIRWPVGVIRSMGAYYLYRFGRRFDLPFSLMDILAIIGILILILNPLYCQSLGFLLSFLMTYIIKFYSQQVVESPYQWRSTVELTMACLVFSWPLVMMISFEWNPVQLLVVILFGILFDYLIMPAIFITTFLLYVPLPFSESLIQLMSKGYEIMWHVGVPINWIEAIKIITGRPTNFILLTLMLVACLWLYLLKRRPRVAYSVLIISYSVSIFVGPYLNASTRLTILDVGQGDSLLYQPAFSKQNWLVDTGGRAVWGERSESLTSFDLEFAAKELIPALKALGVNRLTGIIITHPDMDHMGNLASLNDVIPIENLLVTPYVIQSETWQEMQPFLTNIPHLEIIRPSEAVQVNGLPLTIFSLSAVSDAAYVADENSNDSSLVTLIRIGETLVLNLGDLSRTSEQKLIEEFTLPTIAIIKLAHHGSNTSTSQELLNHLKPNLALVSAGKENRYGFPHPDVLERLADQSVPYLSTHQVGAIQITYHPFWGYSLKTAIEE